MDVYTRIVRAKFFIDEHYAAPLDLDKLSEQACFSKYHFLRVFRKTYRRTPHQYLSERRIEKAMEKLKDNAVKINDVCEAVGFESSTSFIRKFKRYTGETPAAFRQQALKTKVLVEKYPQRFIPSCFAIMFDPSNSNSQ